MKLKLDENIGRRGIELFRQAGFEVATVAEQGLTSATDQTVMEVCRAERRCLVTLDLDFASPIRFPPQGSSGIAVLRVPHPMTRPLLLQVCQTMIRALASESIDGRLWIIEPGRIRQHDPRS